MKPALIGFLRFIRNKYVITIIIFAIVIGFLVPNNLMVTRHIHKQVIELNQERDSLILENQRDSILTEQMSHDLDAIEKYGREEYFLKRADEDLYIIVD